MTLKEAEEVARITNMGDSYGLVDMQEELNKVFPKFKWTMSGRFPDRVIKVEKK